MRKNKILLIDDDPFLRTLYTDILSAENFSITTAADGEEGLRKIQNEDWNLILVDVILPKLDGVQILEQLKKKSPEKLKLKIIFLTNLENDKMLDKISNYGLPSLIKSKLNPDQFVKKIKEYLSFK